MKAHTANSLWTDLGKSRYTETKLADFDRLQTYVQWHILCYAQFTIQSNNQRLFE